MVRTSSVESLESLQKAETDIAVLQVQYTNLNEKVDGVRDDLKDLRDHIDSSTETTQKLIKEVQTENNAEHKKVQDRINALEKWRWMLMGAGVLAGGLGWSAIAKLLGM